MKMNKSIIALFLLPAVLIYLVIFLYPTLRTLAMSFYDIPSLSSQFAEWHYVGLLNYKDLMHSPYFVSSMKNVLGIWAIGGVLIFAFAFLYAVILASKVRGTHFWRSVIFLPNTVSAVVLSVVWLQYIFNSSYGLLTTVFRRLGLTALADIQWTDNEHIYFSMIIAFSFGSIGYFMLILNAGINRIPGDYYEAATLEGASQRVKFFAITLPLLRDVFRTTLVLWTITAFNFFVWSATFGLDDPHTVTPAFYMYQKVFGRGNNVYVEDAFNVGSGASVGILITLATLIASALISRLFPKDRLEY
ncbi:carbohydrate ABC transporter permease [Paenibacillus sacheonensis]|uniref:ABC transporter permease subunit n=1 Tax=Paenibacillus sacheonensis TaxID=742054 RepID=A0A7X4YTW5_9BACL|nr:sugar ABC transporter permease [Paenibacillus sacheonensis]MBM7568809.1 multiple sugar transport system permease protein/N-acetylglucosamine transport system permease protein [Paenibacillus sacheonensis]NBC72515.1 ABC transporter permease subunit [Paenibacillus sacheonensis]